MLGKAEQQRQVSWQLCEAPVPPFCVRNAEIQHHKQQTSAAAQIFGSALLSRCWCCCCCCCWCCCSYPLQKVAHTRTHLLLLHLLSQPCAAAAAAAAACRKWRTLAPISVLQAFVQQRTSPSQQVVILVQVRTAI
jgi:hypothetical protein